MPPAADTQSGAVAPVSAPTSTSGAPRRTLKDGKVPYEVLKYIPQESAEHYQLVPIGLADGVLEVGMVDPDNIAGVDALNFIARKTGVPFKVFRITPEDLEKYGNSSILVYQSALKDGRVVYAA